MAVDDSVLREFCSDLGLGYHWQIGRVGTKYVCRISTDRNDQPYIEAGAPPAVGEQTAFDDALENVIGQTRWRKKAIPEQYRQK